MNEFLILLVLKIKSCNIYEIQKYINENFAPFIQLSVGAIIPALNRLEKSEAVTKEKTMTEGGLKKTIYSFCDNGEKLLNDYLISPIDAAPQLARRETDTLLYLLENNIFTIEQKKLLQDKLTSALNTNISLINKNLSNSNFNIEFLQMELIYTEAKLRHIKEIVAEKKDNN